MPNLKYLNTSNDTFLLEKRQYLSIKQLIYRKYKLKSIDMIIKCLPQLTTLTVDHFGTFPYEISTFISSIFIRLSSFKSISSYYGSKCIYDQKQYEKSIQKALILVQTMNHSLRHVTLDFECGTATFYRRNF
ncbi:hypothetical protein I4U23_005797 [Adineta vaga]|nr:hypothetical protein I4U23_005797 [Adineta vaga]